MLTGRNLIAATLSIAAGMALWSAAALLTGKHEPWDAPSYWTVAYPVAIAISALLGYFFCERPWRWALLLFEAQFLALFIKSSDGGLWPLAMGLFALMALPAIFAATVAARFASSSRFGD